MKHFIKLVLVFVFSYCGHAQNPSKSLYFRVNSTADTAFQKPIIHFQKPTFNASLFDLQIYNPSMGLFENYIYIADTVYKKSDKMNLNYTCNYFFNSSSNTLLNPLRRRHIDAFNPYGVSNLGGAFALGLLNLFLKKID
jgi:hypothetical protein